MKLWLMAVLFALLSFSVRAAEDIKIACVGDSITFGAGTSNPGKASYPSQLQGILGAGYKIGNFGRSGATLLNSGDLPYTKQPEYQKALAFAPDVVVIMLGTNDSKPQNWKHKEEYEADYEKLVDAFAALPSKPKIWLILPVPAFGVNFGIRGDVIEKETLPMVMNVAKKKGLPTIDLHTALKENGKDFPDKIHPNDAGAKVMAENVAKVLNAALKK